MAILDIADTDPEKQANRKPKKSIRAYERMSVDLESLPTKRSAAVRLGAKHYFTGKPCKNGHITFRYTSNEWCAECAYKAGSVYITRFPVQRWAYGVFYRTQRLHTSDDIPFDLDRKYIESLATERCPALGIRLTYGSTGIGYLTRASASLDRIIPSLGYVRGNVVVISHAANRIKNDATSAEIAKVVDWLSSVEEEITSNGSYSPSVPHWEHSANTKSKHGAFISRPHVKVMFGGQEMLLRDACKVVGTTPTRVRRLFHSVKGRSYQDAFEVARTVDYKPRRKRSCHLS